MSIGTLGVCVFAVATVFGVSACTGVDRDAQDGTPSATAQSASPQSESATPSTTAVSPPVATPTSAPTIEPHTDGPSEGEETPTGTSVEPTLTLAAFDPSSGDIVVGGFVAGVVESGGTCLFTLTQQGTSVETSIDTVGVDNADTTSCGSANVPATRLSSGVYDVVLAYSHGTVSGESPSVQVEVP